MIPQPFSFSDAIRKPYRAAMFDIDGTLTEMGESHIPKPLRRKLCEVSAQIPVAFCSGRKFEGIEQKLEEILAEAAFHERERLRSQWYFFLENGAIGVHYNPKTQRHERFYSFEWPEAVIPIRVLRDDVVQAIASIAPSEVRCNEFNVGVYPQKKEGFSRASLAEITARIAARVNDYVAEKAELETFHVVDSGVAVHVMPKFPDKDYGIVRFAEVLKMERGMEFEQNVRDMKVVGDQPGSGFNDARFLEGRVGTPFTVGHRLERTFPISVEKDGVPLIGPDGTLHLLNAIRLAP